MTLLFRWLLRLFLGISALGLAALFAIYVLASRSIPEYSADFQVAKLDAPLEIVRNNANVPHIFGQTDNDAYFGLGFVHAQDRLWQMMMLRRTAQGRLSEIFGEQTLKTDIFMRQMDFYNLAVKSVSALDPETLGLLQAYADGVNAWLDQVNQGALGRGAPEFFMFSNAIAPWQPADSLVIIKLMAIQMSDNLTNEILRARTSLVLGPNRLRDLLPDDAGAAVAELPEYAALWPQLDRYAALATGPDASGYAMNPLAAPGMSGASNVWAAAPDRAAAGASLLASDPHLALSAPSLWYLARMELSTGGVIGGSIPGLPAFLVGRSEALGWGPASAYLDDLDLFVEKLNPDNPEEVLTPKGYRAMATRQSIIQVKDAAPVTVTLRWTENGPVLPADLYNVDSVTPPGHVMSMSWTALSDQDTTIEFTSGLMRAQTIEDAIAAGRAAVAPGLVVALATRDRVAMQMIGRIPRRSAQHQTQGRMPSPGWLPENLWQGRFGYQTNPSFVDPEGGILGNTNNKFTDRPFPFNVTSEWGDTQRVQRWRRLMQTREVHTRESFIEAQLDSVSFTARSLLPLVAADLWFTGPAAPDGTPEHRREVALQLLADWNGEMNEHLPEPLIYAAWIRALQERLIRDDLGPLAREFTHVQPVFIERVFRDVDGAAAWCDILQSAKEETCTEIARMALDDALVWITDRYGSALESLRWGDLHEAAHDHQVLGQVPVLNWFVNIRQSTSGGDNTLLRGRTRGHGDNPFLNVHGAGYRGVYDFADPESSVFVISTGQSGHFLSRYFDDMSELWRRGEYIPMSLDPDLARAAAVGITHLTPR